MEQLKQDFSDHSDQSEDVIRMLKIYFTKYKRMKYFLSIFFSSISQLIIIKATFSLINNHLEWKFAVEPWGPLCVQLCTLQLA